MTQYIFAPQSPTDTLVDWDDPSVWSGGVVPNAADADVVIAPITETGTGTTLDYEIDVKPGESFAENTISMTGNEVELQGTMSIAGVFSVGGGGLDMYGGLLSVGSLQNSGGGGIGGSGTITTPSAFDNSGSIYGDGLTLDVGALQNSGVLSAYEGSFDVDVTGSAIPDGGTLTSGTYAASSGGSLVLNLGAAITVDAADIQFETPSYPADENSAIDSVDSNGHTLALQDTLRTIAATGLFSLTGGDFASTHSVTIDGSLALSDGGTFSSASTTISATGSASVTGAFEGGGNDPGMGTISGPLVDNGIVSVLAEPLAGGTLVMAGDVSGSGALVIGPAFITPEFGDFGDTDYLAVSNTLELQSADSVGVTFQSGAGELVLDDPQGFSGTIATAAPEFLAASTNGTIGENLVQLTGISAASVTSYTYLPYTGSAPGGVLTISEGGVSQTLHFAGDLGTQSFALSAGPQPLSSSPPSLDITITPVPAAPTIAAAGGAAEIVNSTTPMVTGSLPAGASLRFTEGGVVQIMSSAVTPGQTAGSYTAELGPLPDGAAQIYAVANNAAGSTTSLAPISLFVLPNPVDGITTASADSLQISALQNAGYGMQFVAGTETIQLTDGTLSVGPDSGDAYLQRLYEGLLGRPGDPAGLEANAAQLQSAGMAALATDFLGSAEFQALHPGVASLSNGNFVVFLYQSFLARAPDAGGFAAFTNALNAGASRGSVVAAIANSGEAKADFQSATAGVWVPSAAGGLITELYHTALDRAPDLGGLSVFTSALQHGATLLQLAQAITASPEFAADHAGQNATGLITSFYEDGLGRAPDAGGLQTYLGALQAGASVGQVLLDIATSPEAGLHLLPSIT